MMQAHSTRWAFFAFQFGVLTGGFVVPYLLFVVICGAKF
jgi:hypothetical protein